MGIGPRLAVAVGVVAVIATTLLAMRSCDRDPPADSVDISPSRAQTDADEARTARPAREPRGTRRGEQQAGESAPQVAGVAPVSDKVPSSLVVEVVDAADVPVPGAEVVLLDRWQGSTESNVEPIECARGRTDASGAARLDLPGVRRSDAFAIRATASSGTGIVVPHHTALLAGKVRVTLAPAVWLAGRVVFRDGPPVADAVVVAKFQLDRWWIGDRTVTDALGRFTLPAIPRQYFELGVELRSPADGRHREAKLYLPGPPPAEEVVLVAPATCRLHGKCVDVRGNPVEGANVSVGYGPGHSAGWGRTDSTGAFSLPVERRTWALMVSSDGTEFFMHRDVVCDGAELDVGTLVLPDARICKLRGRLLDAAGAPVKDAEVTTGVGTGHTVGYGVSDADARFELKTRYGVWSVMVRGVVWRKDVSCETDILDVGTLSEPPPPR